MYRAKRIQFHKYILIILANPLTTIFHNKIYREREREMLPIFIYSTTNKSRFFIVVAFRFNSFIGSAFIPLSVSMYTKTRFVNAQQRLYLFVYMKATTKTELWNKSIMWCVQ